MSDTFHFKIIFDYGFIVIDDSELFKVVIGMLEGKPIIHLREGIIVPEKINTISLHYNRHPSLNYDDHEMLNDGDIEKLPTEYRDKASFYLYEIYNISKDAVEKVVSDKVLRKPYDKIKLLLDAEWEKVKDKSSKEIPFTAYDNDDDMIADLSGVLGKSEKEMREILARAKSEN